MHIRTKRRIKNRKGVAAVETALCLPLLIIIWMGTFEVSRQTSLRQQTQLLASSAANRILETTTPFGEIESETLVLAEALGIEDCQISITRVDSEIVRSDVTIDFSQNSPLSLILDGQQITSTYYSYRED